MGVMKQLSAVDRCSQLRVEAVRGCHVATRQVSSAPLKLIKTSSIKDECRVYMSSYGGGMLQNDCVLLNVECLEGSSLLLESQGNQQLYRCDDASTSASQLITGRLGQGAKVISMPQPVVMHRDAHYFQSQKWALEEDSNILIMEPFHAGRSENGEVFDYGSYGSELELSVDGRPFFLDRLRSQPHHGAHPSFSFGDYPFMLNIYSYGSQAQELHEKLVRPHVSMAKLKISELRSAPDEKMASSLVTHLMDGDSGVLVTRAMARKRSILDKIFDGVHEHGIHFF
jgi:urease accessory protein